MFNININLPLPIDVIIILIGAVFLLITIARKIKTAWFEIPPVPVWGRVLSGLFGAILLFIGIVSMIPRTIAQPSIIIDEPRGEIYSTEEHVSIIVKGRIENFLDELKQARIYILVQPLAAEGLWTQKPAVPAGRIWEVRAYLGSTGEYSAKHGEQFKINAVATMQTLENTYNNIQEVPKHRTYLSEPVTLRVRRK